MKMLNWFRSKRAAITPVPEDKDRQRALKIHNDARALLDLPPLQLCETLDHHAQEQATYFAIADHGLEDTHLQGELGEGESVAMIPETRRLSPMTNASLKWLAERPNWKGGFWRLEGSQDWCHYTQMVWSTTTYVGFGVAKAKSGTTYVVARYLPGGNCRGHEPYRRDIDEVWRDPDPPAIVVKRCLMQ